MNKLILSFSFIILSLITYAQCPPGSITLNTQDDINNFLVTYPTCTEINGDLTISGPDITDLSGLQNLTTILGFLKVQYNLNLSSLNGLENINSISESLIIRSNSKLVNLFGIRNIETITKSIQIRDNGELGSIEGLSNIESLGYELWIDTNPLLSSLTGLENLNSVNSVLSIKNNVSLNNLLGLSGLSSVSEILIYNNDSLIDLIGLENITSIAGLGIGNNQKLENLKGLDNLENITYSISIEGNESLLNLSGLEKLTTTGSVGIGTNPSLNSLEGLNNLNTIKGTLEIEDNDSLTTLNGLNSLNSIEENPDYDYAFGILSVTDNDSLLSLDGLESLSTTEDRITISHNPLLENIAALGNIADTKHLRINDSKLVNLVGLENLASGLNGDVVIDGNTELIDIAALNAIPDIINSLKIEYNASLVNLNGLQNITTIVRSSTIKTSGLASFMGLNNLKTIGGDFDVINSDNLPDFSGLESLETIEGDFDIQLCDFLNSFQGLNELKSVGSLRVNKTTLETFNGLNSLTNIDGFLEIEFNYELLNLTGLENLERINGGLVLYVNTGLTDIAGISNLDYTSITGLEIRYNSELEVCYESSICSYIASGKPASISNNSSGCNSKEEIEANCNNLNIIEGKISFDLGENDCTSLSSFASQVKVSTVNSFGDIFNTYSGQDGLYRFFVQNETYTTSIELDDTIFSISENNFETSFGALGSSEELNFCIGTSNVVNDVSVTVLPIIEARPGFNTTYQIVYENIGTETSNGEIVFQFDSTKQTFVNATQNVDSQDNDFVTFNYIDLFPFQSKTINISLNTEAPPVVNGDDVLQLTTIINSNDADTDITNNSFELSQIVVNSFDPNDKQVLQGSEITIENTNDYLHYLIRFQNTGSASAINVRVRDVLDDKLDWDTFSPISSSHVYNTQISNGNSVDFIFENIQLPAEQDDEPNSHGFVAFKIKPKTDVIVGDIISGKANIYFDFNLPIITNTVSTEVVDSSLSIGEYKLEDSFKIYPNPTNDIIYISSKSSLGIEKVIVYSISGKLLLEINEDTKEINLKHYPKGMYFLNVVLDKGSVTKKIIKK